MKILSVGSDRNLFDPASAVRERVRGYAEATDGYVVVVAGSQKLSTVRVDNKLVVISLGRLEALFWKPREHFDVVTAQDPFEHGLIAWIWSKRLKVQLELQIHTDLLSPYFTRYSLLNVVRIVLARFLLPRADRVRVVSNRIRDALIDRLQISPAKIEVRPIFVDTEKIKNAPVQTNLHNKYPQFSKIVLVASRLTWEKNVNFALDIMKEVNKQLPRVGLVVVGTGPETRNLKARSLKLGAGVIFEPWCNDLSSYYKTADAFLNTSWYEGYGMTLVEARAAGCPVVSTDVGVAKEIGAKIIPHDNSALAARLVIEVIT